ncbi:MAG: sel1 repeat family protein [Xanthomonadales bacterium]|nr:sel1 repeat family protein [Xanthomonadales bacterium]
MGFLPQRGFVQQGDSDAQYNLAAMYIEGEGSPSYSDTTAAPNWLKKAEKLGLTKSQFSPGAIYSSKDGVSRDAAQAMHWYTKAAEQGSSDAQFNLATMYANENSVSRDYIQAHRWYSIAVNNGHKSAETDRETVTLKMTLEQLLTARKLASEWPIK